MLTGSVINMKFDLDFLLGEDGAARFFVKNRIPELQFNFARTKTLLNAQTHPHASKSLKR